MQTLDPPPETHEEHPLAHRRPEILDMAAGALLVVTVALHVAAMFPSYYSGGAGLTATSDQAAEYGFLAAAWAIALAFGLSGPHRTPAAAGLAVGTALTEFGFRLFDVGLVFRYGLSKGGVGLWLMTGAWVVGAAAAVLAALAARRRHGPKRARTPAPVVAAVVDVPDVDWSAPVRTLEDPTETALPLDPTASLHQPDPTKTVIAPDPTRITVAAEDDRHERLAWTVLVVALAVATAGAFLPDWDLVTVTSPFTGKVSTTREGWAFHGPWQQVVGTVLAAVALLVIPVFAMRMRNKAAAAGAVCGSLLVLGSQLLSAVVSVGESYGADVSLRLSGWFTADALTAYALFAAVLVWATVRVESSG